MYPTFESASTQPKRIAIIGSGPVSLLKAIFLSRENQECIITLFDSASVPGGAWYSEKSPNGKEIECGCHIWSYVPKAYDFIEQELGIKLITFKPSPVFISSGLRLPYSIKNTIDTYLSFTKSLITLRWSDFKKFKSDPNMNFKIFGKRNKYPATGSPELISALLEKIKTISNIEIRLNSPIDHFKLTNGELILQSHETEFRFDKVYLTYLSRTANFEIDGEPLKSTPRQVDYIHFLIQSNKPLLKKLSYWRMMNDPIIHRITDISYQTNFNENLFLVGIKDKPFHSQKEKDLFDHVINTFKKYKLIDNSFDVQKIKTHVLPTFYLDKNSLEILSKNEPLISLLHTTDLMHGIHFLLEKS